MTGAEAGFLLLTCQLGNPERRVLTTAQLRVLAQRVRQSAKPDADRELETNDLLAMGYSAQQASLILALLSEQELLEYYCQRGRRQGSYPLTWAHADYPAALSRKLADDRPGCLWYKGDLSILKQPAVALVGSRDLNEKNRIFAREVGRQAALQGYVLVSGNARGADKTAQEACLRAGGKVISVIADELATKAERENVLYLSEEGFDVPFSAQRAISRNRVIHALTERTFVAQCSLQTGGTWDGTVKNLRFGWSQVLCYADGSPAQQQLEQMGAECVDMDELKNFMALPTAGRGLFEEETL